jgi:hypothetical protein
MQRTVKKNHMSKGHTANLVNKSVKGNGLTVQHYNEAKGDITKLHSLDYNKVKDKPEMLKVKKLRPKQYISFE